MSLLIKGMEMPNNCAECQLEWCCENQYGDVMSYECPLIYKGYTSDTRKQSRLANCPLVPVPPHGDLIDRDALRQDWLENGENDYLYDTSAFLESLDYAPTIIPAEEGET